VGTRAGLDIEVRGKILCPCRGSNSDRPVVQPVVRHTITQISYLKVFEDISPVCTRENHTVPINIKRTVTTDCWWHIHFPLGFKVLRKPSKT
jgi:hypothetical protein